MTIDWIKLIGAALLLLTPSAALQRRHVRFRSISSDWSHHWGQILSLGLHTIDLSRAALGAWLLAHAFESVPGARGLLRYGIIVAQAAVMILAVGVQTVICKHPESFNAPFLFVAGMTLGFNPPLIAGFAIVFGAAIASGARVPAAFFPVLAMTLPAVGFLFAGKRLLLSLAAAGSAAMLPWLFALLFSRDLVVTYRARRRVGAGDEVSSPLR